MHELFNPAGLRMVEDRQGAISYGWIAHRVLYARFVGSLSEELSIGFVGELEELVRDVPARAYFGDASALKQYDLAACQHLQRFVEAERTKLAALVVLTWTEGVSPAARAFLGGFDESVRFVADPTDFENALTNVVTPRRSGSPSPAPVWQVHSR